MQVLRLAPSLCLLGETPVAYAGCKLFSVSSAQLIRLAADCFGPVLIDCSLSLKDSLKWIKWSNLFKQVIQLELSG